MLEIKVGFSVYPSRQRSAESLTVVKASSRLDEISFGVHMSLKISYNYYRFTDLMMCQLQLLG